MKFISYQYSTIGLPKKKRRHAYCEIPDYEQALHKVFESFDGFDEVDKIKNTIFEFKKTDFTNLKDTVDNNKVLVSHGWYSLYF